MSNQFVQWSCENEVIGFGQATSNSSGPVPPYDPALCRPAQANFLHGAFPVQNRSACAALMLPTEIVGYSVFVSIATRYMQTFPDQNLRYMEDIVRACRNVLQACGRPQYLQSLFQLWSMCTNSMCILEQMLWPDLPPETSTNLTLPTENQPLSAVLRDDFRENLPLIRAAIRGLDHFRTWFHTQYDVGLHRDTDLVLIDSHLVLTSIKEILEQVPPAAAAQAPGPAALPSPATQAAAPTDPHAPCMVLLPGEY